MSVGICRLPPDFPCGLHPSPGGLRRAQFAGRAFGCSKWVGQRQSCKEGRTGQGDREQGRRAPERGQVVLYLGAAGWQVCKSNQGIGHVLCTVPRLPGTVLLQKRKKTTLRAVGLYPFPSQPSFWDGIPVLIELAITVEQTADFQTLQSWTFNPPWTQRPKAGKYGTTPLAGITL